MNLTAIDLEAGRERTSGGTRISLLDGFSVEANTVALALPDGSQRLLALLALKGRPIRRQTVAGVLWPLATEDQAFSNLRSALARLQGPARAAVASTTRDLGLTDDVTVDIWEAREIAGALVASAEAPLAHTHGAEATLALSADLLPDWYDEWAIVEAEEWRQLRLHSLEILADQLTLRRRYAEATSAALAAIRAEPLRESPRAVLIRVHIAEGNLSEALREFARYRELLMLELDVEPTQRLRTLVADLRTADPAGRGGVDRLRDRVRPETLSPPSRA
jgi:SARP family transcriptional regulator, regulator of embCAB operon